MSEMIQPIIIKKCRQKIMHGHTGSWKVALADFMTAMMTLFLLLWLLASTTPEQRAAIAGHFQGVSLDDSAGSAEERSPLDLNRGAANSLIDLEANREMEQRHKVDEARREEIEQIYREVESERARMVRLKNILERTVERSSLLREFRDQILLKVTPEGLRVQIVDRKNRPMFAQGGSTPKPYTKKILRQLGATINLVPNRISISGHTDASRYSRINYSNWELSSDRANAARRVLVEGGLRERKIERIVGLAATEPFDQEDLYHAVNRRISILVMNRSPVTSRYLEGAVPAPSGAM